MKKRYMFMAVAGVFLYLGAAASVSASAADKEPDETLPEITQIVELQKGEALFLPDNGIVQIEDERVACAGRNGNIEALEEGETEVVVRYKIRVKKTAEKADVDTKDPDDTGREDGAAEKPKEAENNPDKDTEGGTIDPEKDIVNDMGQADDVKNGHNTEETIEVEQKSQTNINADNRIDADAKASPEEKAKVPPPMTEIKIPDCSYPVITLANLKNLSSNNSQVSPCITVQDENLDKSSVKIRLTGKRTGERTISIQREDKGGKLSFTLDPVAEDDEYVLLCEASDQYGNRTVQCFHFSVNQSGTSFVFNGEEMDHSAGFAPEITLENADAVRIVSCAVNGEPVLYEWKDRKLKIPSECLKSGNNRITLSVQDEAGNINDMEPWDFTMPLKEELEADSEPGSGTVKMQKENPAGIIFLLIGSVLVFWERKMCYNGNMN